MNVKIDVTFFESLFRGVTIIGILLTTFLGRAAVSDQAFYIDDSGMYVFRIENDTATIYSRFNRNAFLDNTLSEFVNVSTCRVNRIDGSLFELISIREQQPEYYHDAIKFVLSDTVTSPANDSIYFEITAPTKCRYQIILDNDEDRWLIDGVYKGAIAGGSNDKIVGLSVYPGPECPSVSNIEGQFLGVLNLFFLGPYYENHNLVKVDMPFLTDSTFYTYVIMNEYAMFTDDGFKWRFLNFKKFEPDNDLLKQLGGNQY